MRNSGYAMRMPFSKGFVPDRRSGASPRFMPIMLATVKMKTPHSADPFSSTRICTSKQAFCHIYSRFVAHAHATGKQRLLITREQY